MKLKIRIIFFLPAFYFALMSCNRYTVKQGLYVNKDGEFIKFSNNNIFEYYSHSAHKIIYSSGLYHQFKNKINIVSDSANLPFITKIDSHKEAISNEEIRFHIEDYGFAEKSDSNIQYQIILNDTLFYNLAFSNSLVLKNRNNIKRIDRIKIAVLYDTVDVLGPHIKTPIFSNTYNLENNSSNSYQINLKLHSKMFHVELYKTAIRLKGKRLYLDQKKPFIYCSDCEWRDNVMGSPALAK